MYQIGEFKEFVRKKKFKRISFLYENQESFDCCNPCSYNLEFCDILINEHPATICLRGKCGVVVFKSIKRIELEEENVLGYVLKIVCETNPVHEGIETFTLVAS